MGGIGKTTLATKVFNDPFVVYHFHVRVWVTVSQTYDKRAMLIQILAFIGVKEGLEEASDSRLRELVHKRLMGQRYLIVIDDIWHIETWDNLKLLFPHGNKGSRILITSRIVEVSKHANSNGLIHHLGHMNKEKSWELLCKKVFHGNECPGWSIKPGMQIVENCQGLPLAVVLIAGVLAKEARSEKLWMEIADKTDSYIVCDKNGILETLALSYNHLPFHLRECFLYLGGFPEDHKLEVQSLIWLWVAEGFIEEDGNRSLEDIGWGYLMDLIERNLVIVVDKKSNGVVKACILHDFVRELCLRKAKEERFTLKTDKTDDSSLLVLSFQPVRVFSNKDITSPRLSILNLRSVLYFGYSIENSICSYTLLRVLDLQKCTFTNFPNAMELLVHLRYLAIRIEACPLLSICKLWSLQTLICISDGQTKLPSSISNLVNLRHLWSYLPSTSKNFKGHFSLPSIEKPMHLQTISDVELGANFHKCFPYVKQLTCRTNLDEENDFKSLTYLETLKLTGLTRRMRSPEDESTLKKLTFPATLKKLTLYMCNLPWSDISIIQLLPHLEVLTLKHKAFKGSFWNANGQEFPQLKFLRLEWLDIKAWEACSTSFPCLRRLEVIWCHLLKEIPLEIGDIPTLEHIKVKSCSISVGECVRRIQEEQRELGNYDLKIDVGDSDDLPLYYK